MVDQRLPGENDFSEEERVLLIKYVTLQCTEQTSGGSDESRSAARRVRAAKRAMSPPKQRFFETVADLVQQGYMTLSSDGLWLQSTEKGQRRGLELMQRSDIKGVMH
jgi:hypothetical protein